MENRYRDEEIQRKIDKLKDPKPYRAEHYRLKEVQELRNAIDIITALRKESYDNKDAWAKLYNAGQHLLHRIEEHLESFYGDDEE